MASFHDTFRVTTSQDVTFATSGGASAQSSAFASQTYNVRLVFVSGTAGDGVRYALGASPTATSTSTLLPANWKEVIKVSPGQKLAVLGNGNTTGKVNISELDN